MTRSSHHDRQAGRPGPSGVPGSFGPPGGPGRSPQHPPGASAQPQPQPQPRVEGAEPLQQAWLLAGRLVAGVGQLLLWLLGALGRLLRPAATWATARLYGRQSAPPTRGPGHDGRTALHPTAAAPLHGWIHNWRRFSRSWLFAPLTGLALALAALAELALRDDPVVGVKGAFVVASTFPLVWRREFLRPVAAVVLGAFAASVLTGQRPLIMTAFAALYTLYLLAQNLPRQSAGVLAISSVASTLVVYLASSALDDIPAAAALVAVLAAIGLGDARRVVETAERTNAEANERTTQTLTRLSAAQREQAVLRERARIARELHDVVAHSVSMIAVQAETAPYTMQGLSDEAREGYAEIARTAREALVEMRRLLGVLRADSPAEPEVAPQPRLDGLPILLEQHKNAGGAVGLMVHGEPRPLSATVELSAYRIVQEALTNARRHAPGAEVQVELHYLSDRLAVRVRDDGASAPTMVLDRPAGPWAAEPPGPAPHPGSVGPGESEEPGGHGLLGMRERATMLGGRFTAGPAEDSGFVVEAELPFAREESHRL